jgi:plastocyanin
VARNTVFATAKANGTSTLFALNLGARGGGGGEPPPSEEPPPPEEGGEPAATDPVIATGPGATYYGYLTPIVTINKGQSVSYVNVDPVRHNVSSVDGRFRSELAGPGETMPVLGTELLEAGTYDFVCEPHPGMKGQLIVR